MVHNSTSRGFDDSLHEYGPGTEYADMFIEQMNYLYLFSFLLAADREIARKCFSLALDEYADAPGGFMDWVKQEGRRAVLRNAIRMIRPVPTRAYSWSLVEVAQPLTVAARQPFAAITSLSAFERFVFVMLLLEGLPEDECAILLNCGAQDIAIGRELARNIIAAEDSSSDLIGEMHLYFIPTLVGHRRCGIC